MVAVSPSVPSVAGTPFARFLWAVAPPLVYLAILEVVLRVAGMSVPRYPQLFRSPDYWVPIRDEGNGGGYVRPSSLRLAHAVTFEPTPLFLREKPPRGLRVFCLGGSATQGRRTYVGGYADWLECRLQSMLPDRRVEVVNAGNAGWSAEEQRLLLQECLRHSPDVLVWMPGDTVCMPRNIAPVRAEIDSPALTRLRRWILELRLAALLRRILPDSQEEAAAAALGSRDRPISPAERELLERRFREAVAGGIEDAKSAPVALVLCTPPRNLRDRPPSSSRFSSKSLYDPEIGKAWEDHYRRGCEFLAEGRYPESLAALQSAELIDDAPAKLHFTLGRVLEKLSRLDAAREAWLEAVEREPNPARPPSWTLMTIRDLAASREVPLADVERAFHEWSPAKLAGSELLRDGVHPNREGNEQIAGLLLDVFERELGIPLQRGSDSHGLTGERLALNARQESIEASRAACLEALEEALGEREPGAAWHRAHEGGEKVLQAMPDDMEVVAAMGLLEAMGGDRQAARRHLERVLRSGRVLASLASPRARREFRRALETAGVDVEKHKAAVTVGEPLPLDEASAGRPGPER
jgi:tetratricopeptide (TPR) repeat protein